MSYQSAVLFVLPISHTLCTNVPPAPNTSCTTNDLLLLIKWLSLSVSQPEMERVCARQRNSWDGGNLECQAKHRDSCRMYRWLHALSPLCQRKIGVSAQDPNRGAAAECAGDCTNTTVPERGALLAGRNTGVLVQDPNRGAVAECAGDCTNTTVPERGALLAGRNTGVLYSYKTQTEGQLQTVTKTKKQKQSKSTQAEENVRKRAREYKQYIL